MTEPAPEVATRYTPYVVIQDAQIGLMTCRACGALVGLGIDPTIDGPAVHDAFHARIIERIDEALQLARRAEDWHRPIGGL